MAAVNEMRNLQSHKSFNFARSRRASSMILPLSRGDEDKILEKESSVAESKDKVSNLSKDETVYIKALFAALHTALPDTVRVELLQNSLQEICFLVALSPRLCSFSERQRHSLRHPALALAAKRLYWLREAQKELQNMWEKDANNASEEYLVEEQSANKNTRKEEYIAQQHVKEGEPLTLEEIEKALGCDNGWSDFYLTFSDVLRSYRHFFANDKEIEECIMNSVENDNVDARPKSSERLPKAKDITSSKFAQHVKSFHAPFAPFRSAHEIKSTIRNSEIQETNTFSGNERQDEHGINKDITLSDYNTNKKSENKITDYNGNSCYIKSKSVSTASSIMEQNNINVFLTRTNYKIYSRAKECLLAPAVRKTLQLCSAPRPGNLYAYNNARSRSYQNNCQTNMYKNYRNNNNNDRHSRSTENISAINNGNINNYVVRGQETGNNYNGYAQRSKYGSNNFCTYVDDEAEATLMLLEYQDYEEERWEHIGNCYNAMLEEAHRLREYFVQSVAQNAMLNDIIRRFWVRLTVLPTECTKSVKDKTSGKLFKSASNSLEVNNTNIKTSKSDAHPDVDKHKRTSLIGAADNTVAKNDNNNKRTTITTTINTNTNTKLKQNKKENKKLNAKTLQDAATQQTKHNSTSSETSVFMTEVGDASRKTKYNTAMDKNRRKDNGNSKGNDNVVKSSIYSAANKYSQNAEMFNELFAVSFSFSPGVQTNAKSSKKEHIRQVNAAQVFMSPMQYIYLNLRIAEILLPHNQNNHSNELQMEMLTSIREDLLIDASYVGDINTPHSSHGNRSQQTLQSPRTRRRQSLTFGAAPTLFTSDGVPLPTVSPESTMLKWNNNNMTYERRTSLRSNSSHCPSVMPWALSAKSLHTNELTSFSFNSLLGASANSMYNERELNDGSSIYTSRETYHVRSSFDEDGATSLTGNHLKNYNSLDVNNKVERGSNAKYGHARRRSRTNVWDTKCKKEQLPSLSFAQFWHSMMVLADNWTCGVGSRRTVMEYVVFLMELYAEVFAHDWNSDDDALLEEIRQSDERERNVYDSTEVESGALVSNAEQRDEWDKKRYLANTKEEVLASFAKMAEELAEYTSSDSDDFSSFNSSSECNNINTINNNDQHDDAHKSLRSRRRELKRQHSLKRREWLGETLFSSSDLEHSLLSGAATPTKLNSRENMQHQHRKSVELQRDNTNIGFARHKHHRHHRAGSVNSFSSFSDSSAQSSSCETSFIGSSTGLGQREGESEQWKLFQSLCADGVDEDGWEYFDRVNSKGELAHFRRKVILINDDGKVLLPFSTLHRESMSSSTVEYINAASSTHRRRSSTWEKSSDELTNIKQARQKRFARTEMHDKEHEIRDIKKRRKKRKMSDNNNSSTTSSINSSSDSGSIVSMSEGMHEKINNFKYSNYTIHLIEQELDDDGNVIHTRNLHIKRRLTQEEKEWRETKRRERQTEEMENKGTSREEEEEEESWEMHLRTSASEDEMLYWTELELETDVHSNDNDDVDDVEGKNHINSENNLMRSDATNIKLGARGSTCIRRRIQFDALPTQLRRLEERVMKDDYDENDHLSSSTSWSSFSFASFWDENTETDLGPFARESMNKGKDHLQQNTRKRQRVRRHGLRNEMRRYYREPCAYYNTKNRHITNNKNNMINSKDSLAKKMKRKTRHTDSYDPETESIAEGYEDYSVSECDSVDILSKEREARELEIAEREQATKVGKRHGSKVNNLGEEEHDSDNDDSSQANKNKRKSSKKYEGLEPLTHEEKTELMSKKKWLQEIMERKGIPLTDAMFDDEAKSGLLFRLLRTVEEKERVKSSQTNNKSSSLLGKLAKNKNGSHGEEYDEEDDDEDELGIAGFDAQLLSKLFENTEFSLEDLQRSELMRKLLGDSLSGSSMELTPAQVNRIFAALEHYKIDDVGGTKSTMLTGSERRKREKLLEEVIKKEQQRLIENAKRRQERLAALKDNINKSSDASHAQMTNLTDSNLTSDTSGEINLEKQSIANAFDKKRRNNALHALLHNKNDKNDGLTGITGTMYHINTIQRGNLLNKSGHDATDSTFLTNYDSAGTPSLPSLSTLNKENKNDNANSSLPLDSATAEERIRQEELYLEFEKYCREQEQSRDYKYKFDNDVRDNVKYTEEQLVAFFSHLHLGAKDKALLRGRAPLAGTTSLLGGGAFHQEMQHNPVWKNNASHRLRFELGSCQAQWVHKPTHTNIQSSHLPRSKWQTSSNDEDGNSTSENTRLDYLVPAPVKLFTLTTKDNINNAIDESYWSYVNDRDYHHTLLPKIKPQGKNDVEEYLQERKM